MPSEITLRQAAQQALEALEYADACLKRQLTTKTKHEYAQDLLMTAGTALRAALAEPEQPHMTYHGDDRLRIDPVTGDVSIGSAEALAKPQTTHWEGCESVHPECRKQEPVAWMNPSWIDPDRRGWASDSFVVVPIDGWMPLYTAPTPRRPLTEEEAWALVEQDYRMEEYGNAAMELIRKTERAHGIGDGNG